MDKELGKKIKELRTSQGMTLKDLGEMTNLSISLLSLIERGLASTTLVSLKKIAEVLGVDPTYFFSSPTNNERRVIRSFEHEAVQVENSKHVYFSLAGDFEEKKIDPMIIMLLPGETRQDVALYPHEGEEFCYVLEGILTFLVEDKEYELFPGDSIHIPSTLPHNIANFTNKLVKVLYVVNPKIFSR